MQPALPVLISAEQIRDRVAALAQTLTPLYRGQPLTIVGILTGSLIFLADLVRALDLPLRIGLLQASSYRGAATTPAVLKVNVDLLADLTGRHVLLLDDILDTGQTLAALVAQLDRLGAQSVRVAVLLRKVDRQRHAVRVDFVGFDIPNEFVVGYGLDFNDEYRQLPYIAVLPKALQP